MARTVIGAYGARSWTLGRIARGALKYGPSALVDCVAVSTIYVLAVGVRVGGRVPEGQADLIVPLALMAGFLEVAVNILFGVYWRDWSISALEDFLAVARSSAVVAGVLLVFNLVSDIHYIPNSAVVTGAGLVTVVECGLRLGPRWRSTLTTLIGGTHLDRAIVVGAGRTGQLLAADLSDESRGYRIACFVDDDSRRWGTYVRGRRVAGTVDDLPGLIQKHHADVVVIAVPSPTGALVRRVLDRCDTADVRVRAVQPFGLRPSDTTPLRPIGIEELLERETIDLETDESRAFVRSKRILVTGAAGSIGSELCRRLSRMRPELIVLLDENENGLHEVASDLPELPRHEIMLVDIRDRAALAHALAQARPDIVLHAAAYKHVPIVEQHPMQGIRTNIVGTANVLDAIAETGVPSFVFISTDKAVCPVSTLGLTKRFGELLTMAYARETGQGYGVVRFGNVLGSSGSVVPIFARQIDRGGPVTVTDPLATRYFMTIPEAAGLVLEAGALANPGDVMVLDMGAPISILELAQKMIKLRGLRVGSDVPIEFIGLRPGERLSERLFFADETPMPTRHPRVTRAVQTDEIVSPGELRRLLDEIRVRTSPGEAQFLLGRIRSATRTVQFEPDAEIQRVVA